MRSKGVYVVRLREGKAARRTGAMPAWLAKMIAALPRRSGEIVIVWRPGQKRSPRYRIK